MCKSIKTSIDDIKKGFISALFQFYLESDNRIDFSNSREIANDQHFTIRFVWAAIGIEEKQKHH